MVDNQQTSIAAKMRQDRHPSGCVVTHHDEDDRHGHTKLFLHVVDVVPCVANAEVEHHGRDRTRYQVRPKSFPHLHAKSKCYMAQ